MKSHTFLSAAIAVFNSISVAAVGVNGAAEGFAAGVTGGGTATPVYPTTTAELVSYLGDSSARVIVLTKTYDSLFSTSKREVLTRTQLRLHRYRGHDNRNWLCSLGYSCGLSTRHQSK